MRLSLLTALCAALQACSTHQPAASAATAKAATPLFAPPAAAAPKRNIKVLEDKTLTNEEVKRLLAQNYRPLSRDGKIYYCRREQPVGTRFATMTCRTADEMKQIARESKDMTAAKQKSSGCTSQGPAC